MRKLLALAFFFSSWGYLHAADSLRVLSLEDVYGLVLENHPVVKQAGLLQDAARMELRAARGAFDPQLRSAYDEKRFGSKDYWKVWQSSLRIPVWNGIDLKAEYQQTTGDELDPMLVTPGNGLSSLGIQLPLGQGLLIDARRATLEQARLIGGLYDAERFSVVNKLLLQVNKDYLDWSYGYSRTQLAAEGLRLAVQRFDAIRYKVLLGELPALDSVEALVEVQNRQNTLTAARIDFMNAGFSLSNHLWSDKGEPAQLTEDILPDALDRNPPVPQTIPLSQLQDSAMSAHPELRKMEAKIDQLDIDRRWAAEKLRPKLQLDYGLYSSGGTDFSDAGFFNPYWSDNMRVGLSFSTSLFLREERGKYNLSKLKVQQARFEQQRIRREVYNQLRSAYNEYTLLSVQLNDQLAQVRNAELLLEGEQLRFNEGESSLFLLNSRENALLLFRLRTLECRAKLEKARALVRWSAGVSVSP